MISRKDFWEHCDLKMKVLDSFLQLLLQKAPTTFFGMQICKGDEKVFSQLCSTVSVDFYNKVLVKVCALVSCIWDGESVAYFH